MGFKNDFVHIVESQLNDASITNEDILHCESMFELGFDSLTYIELLVSFETHFKVEFPLHVLLGASPTQLIEEIESLAEHGKA